jgi:anthranilate/para-aminobenzoate synthase component I
VIVRQMPPLLPEEAARRAATGSDPVWLCSPAVVSSSSARAPELVGADVVAAHPREVVRGHSLAEVEEAWGAARRRWSSPGEALPAGVPVGMGWFSYDLARRWGAPQVDAPLPSGGPWSWPDLELRFFDALWIRSAEGGAARIVACDEAAADRLQSLLARAAPADTLPPPEVGALAAERSRASHEAAVGRIRDYLTAGDAYQVNLARRLSAPMGPGDPVWLATRLRAGAPAPHAIWLGAHTVAEGPVDAYIVGNSPERFLHVDPAGHVQTQPIKGTRPRAPEPGADRALGAALTASAKDRAEHVMIVDLERNDLGRLCRTGSVRVDELMRLVALPTVFHLVSTVRGRLRADVGLEELLRATFPGGSVTGAPKRRAMEIIDELEPARRGIYTGATGWLGGAGDLDLAVAIRTATVTGGRLSLWVGGGIVADSDPSAEWEETEVKARAFRAACGH